jgi:DNA-binding FadR family transcriptional regulator
VRTRRRSPAQSALRSSPSHHVQLEDVLTRSALRLDAEASLQLDVEFHLLLAHAAQNPLLVALCTITSRSENGTASGSVM